LAASTFDKLFTFTRASAATIIDIDGTGREVAVDVPRLIEYDRAGVAQGLLIEEQRENLFEYPRNFDGAQWTANQVTVHPYDAVGPDGRASATAVVLNAASDRHFLISATNNTVTSGESYAVGFVVKHKAGNGWIQLALSTGFDREYANFNLITGVVGNSIAGDPAISPLGNGWFYVSCNDPADSTGQGHGAIGPLPFDIGSRLPTFTGDGTAGFHLWHAQLEEGSFPSSVIPDGTTFTSRSTVASFVDSAGVLQEAAIDVARDDAYKYIDGILYSIGLLIEAAATNLFLNSDTLSTQDVTVAAETHTLHFTGTGTVTLSGTFAGSLVGTGTGEDNRVSLTFTPTAGTLTATVTGTVTNAMVEENHHATSYFSSDGSQGTRAADISSSPQATRAADNCVRTLGDEFNPNQWSMYLEATLAEDPGNFQYLLNIQGSGSADATGIQISNMYTRIRADDATTYQQLNADNQGPHKYAIAFDGARYIIVRNGVSTGWAAGAAIGLTTAGFPLRLSGSLVVTSGAIYRDFRIIPTALSEAELITLTGG